MSVVVRYVVLNIYNKSAKVIKKISIPGNIACRYVKFPVSMFWHFFKNGHKDVAKSAKHFIFLNYMCQEYPTRKIESLRILKNFFEIVSVVEIFKKSTKKSWNFSNKKFRQKSWKSRKFPGVGDGSSGSWGCHTTHHITKIVIWTRSIALGLCCEG